MGDYKDLQKPLEISDIDFRVQSINKGGYATILAYKDARVDMRRLDEALGIENWQRDVKFINGVLYGGVGIYNKELKEWIWKWDAGTESNTEKEKGQSSDAFKRACFNLGIGRELYNYPVINVKLNSNEFKIEGTRAKATWDLKLKEWKWLSQFTDGEITFLAAKDEKGVLRWKWGSYDKDRETEETLASGSAESNPHEHESDNSPTVVEELEGGNTEGLLKKEAVPIEEPVKKESPTEEDVKRSELMQKYKLMFGKEPRANTKTETIEKKIAEETAKRLAEKEEPKPEGDGAIYSDSGEVAEEVEEEAVEEVVTEDPYADDTTKQEEEVEEVEVEEVTSIEDLWGSKVAKIETFTDKEELKVWAVDTFKEWTGKVSDEEIADFKLKCNKQFEKIG